MKYIERPIGYEYERKDCVVKALHKVLNKSYEEVHRALKNIGRKDKHGIRTIAILDRITFELNFRWKHIKRSGSVEKLIEEYPIGNIFVLVRGHAFPIIDGIPYELTSRKKHVKGAYLIILPVTTQQDNNTIIKHEA